MKYLFKFLIFLCMVVGIFTYWQINKNQKTKPNQNCFSENTLRSHPPPLPENIPLTNDEYLRFINIAFEKVKNLDRINKNYVTIDMDDDVFYLTFDLPPPRANDRIFPRDDFIACVRINRKTGEIIP